MNQIFYPCCLHSSGLSDELHERVFDSDKQIDTFTEDEMAEIEEEEQILLKYTFCWRRNQMERIKIIISKVKEARQFERHKEFKRIYYRIRDSIEKNESDMTKF